MLTIPQCPYSQGLARAWFGARKKVKHIRPSLIYYLIILFLSYRIDIKTIFTWRSGIIK